MDDIQSLVEAVEEEASADLDARDIADVRQALETIREDFSGDEDALISRVALAVDIENGALQDDYENHVVEQGGFVVERDGVSYGYDQDGNPI